jgi:hypothetical protein
MGRNGSARTECEVSASYAPAPAAVKTTAARTAQARDPQWGPTQTQYNDARFRNGAPVVPPSIWLSKRGLRCQPDVMGQMKLPTALAFAIAAQIHVSHCPAIISPRDRQLLRCCRQRPYAHREIPANRRCSFHRQTQPISRRHNGLLALRGWNRERLPYRITV